MDVLPITIEAQSSEVVGTVVPTMVSLLAVQAMARVLSTIVKLLVVEVIGETASEVGEHGEVATSMLALLEVAHPSRIIPMETGDSSNSWYCDPHLS